MNDVLGNVGIAVIVQCDSLELFLALTADLGNQQHVGEEIAPDWGVDHDSITLGHKVLSLVIDDSSEFLVQGDQGVAFFLVLEGEVVSVHYLVVLILCLFKFLVVRVFL